MNRISTVILISGILALALVSGASAPAQGSPLYGYISQYLSNSSIGQYSYHNVTTDGLNYVVMQSAANQSSYLVVNSTGGKYKLLTNATLIDSVLVTYIQSNSNLSQVSYLETSMQKYIDDTANLTDCLQLTGVYHQDTGANYECTSNTSESSLFTCMVNTCETIPVCGGAQSRPVSALESLGVPSPFAYGIQNFSIQNAELSSDYSTYFSLLNGINSSNVGENVSRLGPIISNISDISSNMDHNPIFPPPESVSFSECNNLSANPNDEPWYCVAVGFCNPITFNSTLLNNISATQIQLAAEIPSPAEIDAYGSASAGSASNYITQAIVRKNETAYNIFINASYPVYNKTVAQVSALLSKVSNPSLNSSLSALKSKFASIQANGLYESVAVENESFQSLIANTLMAYASVNGSYASANSEAFNATIDAVAAQLNYKQVPVRLALIAGQLQSIDENVTSTRNSTKLAELTPEIRTIDLELAIYVAPFTMGHAVKILDGWFVHIFLSGSNAPVQSKETSSPIYAAIESFIIGIVIVAVIYLMTYRNFSKRHKLRKNKRAGLAWKVLFVVLFILVLAYSYVTYTYAASANSFLPLSYFTSYLKGSKSAYIILNGSSAYSSQSVTQCAQAISAALSSQGKNVTTIQATNDSCVADGSVSSLGADCYDSALAKGIPIISLSASGSGISYKGLYGYVMYASGGAASGPSCIASSIISRKG